MQDGRLRRLARAVYTDDHETPAEDLIRARRWDVVARLVPDALVADRSAFLGALAAPDGSLFVVSAERSVPLRLPGLTIRPRSGVAPLDDDPLWVAGLRISSTARALAENLRPSRARAGVARTLSWDEYEEWVVRLAQDHTPDRLNRVRNRARDLADEFGLSTEFSRLDDLFGAALGTRTVAPRSRLLQARVQSRDWDLRRIAQFEALADYLRGHDVKRLPVRDVSRTRAQPQFEAYFSNFIEGTEFLVDEALDIIRERRVPAERPGDAHDILGTYQEIVTRPGDVAGAGDSDGFVDLLRGRHRTVMAGRVDEVPPGRFKTRPNRAGGTEFVAPAQVVGTLRRGHEVLDTLDTPFARAVFTLFLVNEVHPFVDGNGRVARLAANAELSAAGEHRIVVPTVHREPYIDGLRRLSRDGAPKLLVSALEHAWRWTSQVDWSDEQTAKTELERTDAQLGPFDGAFSPARLLLPAELAAPEPVGGVAPEWELG